MWASEQKYDIMDPILENIYTESVKLDEEETKALNERFGLVIDEFVKKMKEVDATFNRIFNRIHYTGSFYDGLRISEATEYDLNLVLKPDFLMKLNKRRRPCGYIGIEVSNWSYTSCSDTYKDWINSKAWPEASLLNPNAVRWWLQGVTSKALKELKKEGDLIHGYQLKLRQSGPACTLSITSEKHPRKTIDIDLVPVLEFTTGYHPQPPKKRDIRRTGLQEPWFAVPKPPTYNCPCKMCICWRMSFPIQESAIMQDLKFFKYTLRMVKKVRDELGMKEIASYYIKTLFLHELQENGREMWSGTRRGWLFMHMLKKLKEALDNGKILFFWNPNCNLIGNLPKESLLIPPCVEETPKESSSVPDKDISHLEGLMALQSSVRYVTQQIHSDVPLLPSERDFLDRWLRYAEKNLNK